MVLRNNSDSAGLTSHDVKLLAVPTHNCKKVNRFLAYTHTHTLSLFDAIELQPNHIIGDSGLRYVREVHQEHHIPYAFFSEM